MDRLRAAGIGFTIISARPMSGMMPIADTIGIDAPMGAFNGGTIFRRDGTVLEEHHIPSYVVDGVLDLARDEAVDIWIFAEDRWHATTDQGEHVDHERLASAQEPVVTKDFSGLSARADKLTLVSDDGALLARLHDEATSRFGEDATIAQSQTYYLDVTALRANKGDGVVALGTALDVPLAAMAVLGDMANDVPMFERAAFSVAMGQAPAPVKAAADEVSTSNDDDGVAHAIDAFLLTR